MRDPGTAEDEAKHPAPEGGRPVLHAVPALQADGLPALEIERGDASASEDGNPPSPSSPREFLSGDLVQPGRDQSIPGYEYQRELRRRLGSGVYFDAGDEAQALPGPARLSARRGVAWLVPIAAVFAAVMFGARIARQTCFGGGASERGARHALKPLAAPVEVAAPAVSPATRLRGMACGGRAAGRTGRRQPGTARSMPSETSLDPGTRLWPGSPLVIDFRRPRDELMPRGQRQAQAYAKARRVSKGRSCRGHRPRWQTDAARGVGAHPFEA